jgi:hypothetical protein
MCPKSKKNQRHQTRTDSCGESVKAVGKKKLPGTPKSTGPILVRRDSYSRRKLSLNSLVLGLHLPDHSHW